MKLHLSKLFFLTMFFFSSPIYAQLNLVPNSSFEVIDTCPSGLSLLHRAPPWNSPMNGTPDLHNSCSNGSSNSVGTPQNLHGYQFARTGDSYAGIISYLMNGTTPGNYREYIQAELLGPLVAGEVYFVQFFVSPGDSCKWVTNNIGLYFSPVEIDTVIPNSPLPFQPQIENPITNNLGNPNNWSEFSGYYTATGNEKFIIIGNFRNGVNSTGSYTGWGVNFGLNFSVQYIDDVLITHFDSLTSDNLPDSETGLILETHFNGAMYQILSDNDKIISYEIINVIGEIVQYEKSMNSNQLTLNLEKFSKGIYLLKVKLSDNRFQVFKIYRS